jgi:RNA polymerase sigma-70 factor, ECF subfamily
MLRLRRGDCAALGELYRRYARLVFTVAMTTLHDRQDAEDVAHDAFIAVVERAQQFDPSRGSPLAWLIATARNLAIDLGRRQARRARILDEGLRHEPTEPSPQPDARSSLERRRAELDTWLACITAAQRRTLEIAFEEGLSYAEIATREGVRLGTVKSRAARGLHTLRAALGADG